MAAGLLVRNRGALGFIAASLVRAIRYDCVVTDFPSTELGMTLFSGRVIPVLRWGDDDRALIVCDIDGELVGVLGPEPIQSGFFEGDDEHPLHDGLAVPHLNIREQLDRWRLPRRWSSDHSSAPLQEDPWLT